jgi:hypothetical protein
MLSDISSAEECIEKAKEVRSISNFTSTKSSSSCSSTVRKSSSSGVSNCRPAAAKFGYVAPKHTLNPTSLVGKTAFEIHGLVRKKRGSNKRG